MPNATYEENEEITFSIAPKVGWLVESVTFNGEKITANETGLYTITIKAQDNILAVNYSSEDASKVQEGGNLSNQDNNIIQENEPVQEKIGCNSSLLGTSLVSSLAVVLSALIALAIRRK